MRFILYWWRDYWLVLRPFDADHADHVLLLVAPAAIRAVVVEFRIAVETRRVIRVRFVGELLGVAEAPLYGLLELQLLNLIIMLVDPFIMPVVVDEVLFPFADAV